MEGAFGKLLGLVYSKVAEGLSSTQLKPIVIRESKRVFKKVLSAVIFFGVWKKLENVMEKCYKGMTDLRNEHGMPDEDYDPRDAEEFMKE